MTEAIIKKAPVVAKLWRWETIIYPKQLSDDINKKSDAFIQSRLAMMRQSL